MQRVPHGAPMTERGGRLRGVIDLVAGRYPPFLFGLGVGNILPVFHFHETTPDALEPAFSYLVENGYRAVTSDDAAALVRTGKHPGARTVMLAFDDALASLWMVVGPLLEKYDLRAVAYAIPARIADAAGPRPTMTDGPVQVEQIDASDTPFVTWPELRALSASGRVDVQSHTFSHSMVFAGGQALGVIGDGVQLIDSLFSRPRLNDGASPEFLSASRVGYPVFARRSRMSDGRRFWPDAAACERVEAFVREQGGTAFLARPGSTGVLAPKLAAIAGRWESESDQCDAVAFELDAGRQLLEHRLGTPIRHVCLPWGISGAVTRAALERLGMATAFANRLAGRFAVAAGDDPYFLKRLHCRHIFALPGRGRRTFVTLAGSGATAGTD
jgi:hypothetical protein